MPRPSNIAVLGSSRISFQWKYVWWFLDAFGWKDGDAPIILNVGCSDDPVGFGDAAMHCDLDDWSAYHKYFTQGDARALPFGDETWQVVVMADVLEHIVDPMSALQEVVRVCKPGGFIILTIFEEWRLPGRGQWIEVGQAGGDVDSRMQGYEDRFAFQTEHFPDMIPVDDVEIPHLCHINQFTDADIQAFLVYLQTLGCVLASTSKELEVTHEGHDVFNWLICVQKRRI